MTLRQKTSAFTLIEILVVVVILGIVAAIVIPRFANASTQARESMLAENLRIIRTQITVFQGQHSGVAAGYPGLNRTAAPTQAAFLSHMTTATDQTGALSTAGTPGVYGPYFTSFPSNPLNSLATVLVLTDTETLPAAGDNGYGWVYQPFTLKFRADSPGTDSNGKNYFEY